MDKWRPSNFRFTTFYLIGFGVTSPVKTNATGGGLKAHTTGYHCNVNAEEKPEEKTDEFKGDTKSGKR